MPNEKNISKLQLESIVRSAKLLGKYKKEITEGNQKNEGRQEYAMLFEAFVYKYLPSKITQNCFIERGAFKSNKSYNKFLKGKYKDVSKIDTGIILRVCLTLLMKKEEIYDLFYYCGHNLWEKDGFALEKSIIDLYAELDNLDIMMEEEKKEKAYRKICQANKMLKENGRRGMFINDPEGDREAEEYLKDLEEN